VKPLAVPTIFGHRMRRDGDDWKLRVGKLLFLIDGTGGLPCTGGCAPFGDSFHRGKTPEAVAAKLEAWVVKHLLGKTLGALGFEARRVRS